MAKFYVRETLFLSFEFEAKTAEQAMEMWQNADSNDAVEHETVEVVVSSMLLKEK